MSYIKFSILTRHDDRGDSILYCHILKFSLEKILFCWRRHFFRLKKFFGPGTFKEDERLHTEMTTSLAGPGNRPRAGNNDDDDAPPPKKTTKKGPRIPISRRLDRWLPGSFRLIVLYRVAIGRLFTVFFFIIIFHHFFLPSYCVMFAEWCRTKGAHQRCSSASFFFVSSLPALIETP